MAALPRRKSLKLRLVELREGKLGSLGRSVGGWIVEGAEDREGAGGTGPGERRWK